MFLQVVTRTFGQRPTLLAKNQASLAAQSDTDWAQTLVVDQAGRGVSWANRNLATVPAIGQWLWILDDDDECIMPDFVAGLRAEVRLHDPHVVMVRMNHGPLGILPDDGVWGQEPQLGRIGMSAFVVRGDVWEQSRSLWGAVYEADFHYIHTLWAQEGLRFHWWDVVASRVHRISGGVAEREKAIIDASLWERRGG